MRGVLIDHICQAFARHPPRANTWSRVLGGSPEPRVDTFELFTALALTCRGGLKDTLCLLFSLFDLDGTGVLGEDDLGALVSSCGSVLRRLGLSLPITADDAAFVVGGAFVRYDGEHGCVDGIDLEAFLKWARRTEVPIGAFEVLALPHRLSRAVDQAVVKIMSLRCRYSTIVGDLAQSKPIDTGQYDLGVALPREHNPNLNTELIRMQFLECGTIEGTNAALRFSLPPTLSWLGPHGVSIALEAGPGRIITTASIGASWCVVVVVEERNRSCFSLVDAQPVVLEGGKPVVFQISRLRAGTDHRFRLVCKARGRRSMPEKVRERHGRCLGERNCGIFRFKTLHADAITPRANMACEAADANNPEGNIADKCISTRPITRAAEGNGNTHRKRRHIEIVGAFSGGENSSDHNNSCDKLSPPSPKRLIGGERDYTDDTGETVAVIRYGKITSTIEVEDSKNDGGAVGNPWWTAASAAGDTSSVTISNNPDKAWIQTWPPDDGVNPPPPNHLLEPVPTPSIAANAPFCGENIARAAKTEPWSRIMSAKYSDGADIIVHMCPVWLAPEAMHRCFRLLEESRGEMASVREDAKLAVSREAFTAVKTLLSRMCGALRVEAERRGAHVILGDIDPWLGLNVVSQSGRMLERTGS